MLSTHIETRILFDDEAESLNPLSSSTTSLPPTVFTGQRLRGTLSILGYEACESLIDTAQIFLKGKVSNVVKLNNGFYCMIERPLVVMSTVKIAEDFEQITSKGSSRIAHQVGFFFDIPEFVTVPSPQKYVGYKLPPSIRVTKSPSTELCGYFNAVIGGQCDVTYHIEAKISRNGKILYENSREIIVMPVTEIPPPLDPNHLQNEYRLSATSSMSLSLKPSFKRNKSMKILVSSTEPQPLVFEVVEEGRTKSTEILLDFITHRIGNQKSDASLLGPGITECKVLLTLEAITYFTDHETDCIVSTAEAQQSPCVLLKKTRFKTQKRKMKLLEWEPVREIADPRTVQWKTATSLTTVLPDDASHLPSFFSTLVSRRYAFDLQIVVGTGLGTVCKPLYLRIPVQLVHAPVEIHPKEYAELKLDEELKAPMYVP